MSTTNPIWLEGRRRYWQRHDWPRFIRHDAHRFLTPAGLAKRRALDDAQEEEARAAFAVEVKALQAEQDRLCEMLAAIKHELAFRRIFRKYSPDQPRVPAGSPDGGQWTSGDGSESSATFIADDDGSDNSVDLTEEERLGGHVIGEHIAKSDDYLKKRVRTEASKIIDRGDDFRGLSVGSFFVLGFREQARELDPRTKSA